MDGVLASHPAAPGWIPGVPEDFSKKFDNVASLIDSADA